MIVYPSSFGGVGWQFFNANGVPLSGGKIFTYAAGTTTPAATYTDVTGNTAHTNPIILNAAGRVSTGEIWQPSGLSYKFILTDSNDVVLGTFDNVISAASGLAAVESFTGTGTQTIFNLTSLLLGLNTTNVYISGVYQQKSTYSLTGTTLTFSEAPPATSKIEVTY